MSTHMQRDMSCLDIKTNHKLIYEKKNIYSYFVKSKQNSMIYGH